MREPTPDDETTSKPAISPDTVADLKAIVEESRGRSEEENMPKEKLAKIVTKPESKRYEPSDEFIFLVHAPLNIQDRTTALGLDEFTLTERPLNTTLIDQDHTWTFEGMSGLIIEPPESDEEVLGAWSYDSGLNDMVREKNQPDATKVLEETRPDNYNQVNIRSGRVTGVYIRVREDGSEIGDTQRSKQLREFAATHNLPVAEIVVEPQNFADHTAEVHKPTSDLTSVEFSIAGKKYRVDALTADPSRPLEGDTIFEGHYVRARSIDQYGEANGDVKDSASLQTIVDQLQPLLSTDLDQNTRNAVEAMIKRYQQELDKLNTPQ
jgi:hypothetical protein